MGIDVPAFRRGVDRPQDQAVERGELRAKFGNILVTGLNRAFEVIHRNTSTETQFLTSVSLVQSPTLNAGIQDDVEFVFTVQDVNANPIFRGGDVGGSLNQRVEQVPIDPGDSVKVEVNNKSNSDIRATLTVTFRE
jgi:hypothetical protein